MALSLRQVMHGAMFKGAQRVSLGQALGTSIAAHAVSFGGGVALGEVYSRYSDKWYGKHAPEMLAGAGFVLEGVLTAFMGPGLATGVVGALGRVGSTAIGLDLGLNHGRKAAGIALVKVPAGTDVRKLKRGDAVPAGTAVGALPQAAAGHGLAWDHIQDLASSY